MNCKFIRPKRDVKAIKVFKMSKEKHATQRYKKRPFKTCTSFYRKVKMQQILKSRKIKYFKCVQRNFTKSKKVNKVHIETISTYNLHDEHNYCVKNDIFEQQLLLQEKHSDISSDISEEILTEKTLHPNEDNTKLEESVLFLENLQTWALNNKITHLALNDLIKLLRLNGFNHLPKDSRTLLQTPTCIENIAKIGNGSYWYYGVEKCLMHILSQTENVNTTQLSLIVHIDGLPIANSSKIQFWPILCAIKEISNSPIAVVGIYYGESKPPLQEFLEPFVNEMMVLLDSEVRFKGHKFNVKMNYFVCDSPARTFVKGIVNFNSYHGCTKCSVIGNYDFNKMSFPRINCSSRTNEDFRNRVDEDHHKCMSPLELLPIDMVTDFIVADSLHLLHLGVMKKLLLVWTTGMYTFDAKWSATDMKNISELLKESNLCIPRECHRAVRPLDCLKFWKGVEFQVFLMYLGPVILKDFLRSDIYEHFVLLFCAVTICSSNAYKKYVSLGKQLLDDYIEIYIDIYGSNNVTSNVHNLSHLVNDVIQFGPLPDISSYKFENFLGYIKSLLRQGNKPLAQCANRLVEMLKLQFNPIGKKVYPLLKNEFCHNFLVQANQKFYSTIIIKFMNDA